MGSVTKSKLILPSQPFHDDFLSTMSVVFRWVRLIGVAGPASCPWIVWGVAVLCSLFIIEMGAMWKVVKALAGIAIDTAKQRSVTARFAGTIFYTCSLLSLILCWRMSSSWHKIAQLWVSAERELAIAVPEDETLKSRMKRFIGIMTVCAIFEHSMSVISKVGFDCQTSLILRRYILRSHGFLLLRNEYSNWLAVPVLLISIIATALWNFLDMLIVLVSMGLTSRYYRLNKYVEAICREHSSERNKVSNSVIEYTWRSIRRGYAKQALLVKRVDQILGGLIMLSASGNFYFICLQIFLGLTKISSGTWIVESYYLVSLVWLCARMSCMVLAASDVYVQSTRALSAIYGYRTAAYNVEIERLQTQLSQDCVALSGMGFFFLDRTILLQMAGAIVTYELVLLQFDDSGAH